MTKDFSDVKTDMMGETNKIKSETIDYETQDYHHLVPTCFKEHESCNSEVQAQYYEYTKYNSFNSSLPYINNFSPIFNISHAANFCNERDLNQNEKQLSDSNYEKKPNYRGNFNTYITIHTNKKPHGCQYCDKKFSTKQNLFIHCRTHTNEKPYSCDSCCKKFTTKQNLVLHIRTHTNEKPYKCESCEGKFSTKQNLIVHCRTHTREKPFLCEHCDKKFSTKQNLDTHLRTHNDTKPFNCQLCSKQFCTKQNRDTHLKTHSNADHSTDKRFQENGSHCNTVIHSTEKWPDSQYHMKFSDNSSIHLQHYGNNEKNEIRSTCNKATNT